MHSQWHAASTGLRSILQYASDEWRQVCRTQKAIRCPLMCVSSWMKGLWGRQTGSRGLESTPSWEGGKQKVEVSKLKYSEKQDKQKACKMPGEIATQCASNHLHTWHQSCWFSFFHFQCLTVSLSAPRGARGHS